MTEKTKKIMKFGAIGLCAAVLVSAAVIAVPRAERDLPLEAAPVLQVVPDVSAEGSGVSLVSAQISPLAYEDYGILPTAQTAYTLTATVNEDATVKAVDWTIAWRNAVSEWASGKTVTDYVTVSSTGGLTATVQCLRAFGEQIVVSAVSKDDPRVKADCICDYEAKIVGVSVSLSEDAHMSSSIVADKSVTSERIERLFAGKLAYGKDYYFGMSVMFGVGTTQPYAGGGGMSSVFVAPVLSLNETARSKLKIAGYDPGDTGTVAVSLKGYFDLEYRATTIDREALKTLFGQQAATGDDFYNALEAVHAEGYNDILDLKLTVMSYGEGHGPFVCTLDIDLTDFYIPVSDVQVDQSSLQF